MSSPLSAFPPLFFSVPLGEKATRGKADNGMENNGARVENTSTRRTNLEIMNQSWNRYPPSFRYYSLSEIISWPRLAKNSITPARS